MSQLLSPQYWNNRYLGNDFPWDAGAITTPLKTYFDQLKNKDLAILIPGAGNAYEAEYLLNLGFTNVFVCDIAPEPLNNLKKRCPAIPDDHLLLQDFFELDFGQAERNLSRVYPGSRSLDLIIEQTFFCALHPSLRKKYFAKMHEILKPGGKLVGLLFNDVLNSDHPPFGGNKEEYLSYLGNDFKIKTFDPCYNSIKPRKGRELFINLERVNN